MEERYCHRILPPLLFSLLALFSSPTLSTVSHPEDGRVSGRRNNQTPPFALHQDRDQGLENSPHTLYYPLINSCNGTDPIETDARALTRVPLPQTNAPCNKQGNLQGLLEIQVLSDVGGYLYAALGTSQGDSFQVMGGGAVFASQGETTSFQVDIGSFCSSLSCILPTSDTAILSRKLLIFTSPEEKGAGPSPGDSLTSSDLSFQEGVFFHVQISRKLPSLQSGTAPLPQFELFAGDASAFVNYDVKDLSLTPKEIYRLWVIFTPSPQNRDFSFCDSQNNPGCAGLCGSDTSCPHKLFQKSVGGENGVVGAEAREKGEVLVKDLKNHASYHASICIENKWGFCSQLPPTQEVTPLELETFLKEQSCFFFSAGFGRKHPVIENLKWFRDHIMAPTPVGRFLISQYYKRAPPYARFIYKNPTLKKIIQRVGYTLSSLIEFFFQNKKVGKAKKLNDLNTL